MKKRKLLAIICVIVLTAGVILTGCTTDETPPPPAQQEEEEEEEEEPGKVYELTMCTQHPYVAAMNEVVNEAWFDYLEAESGGRLKFTLFPSSQAAKPADLYDAAATGIVDIACMSMPQQPGRWPISEVGQLPFVFNFPGTKQATRTMQALYDKYPEIQAELGGNVVVLGYHANGVSQINNNVRPVYTLEDMEGLVLMGSGTYSAKIVQSLGATPEAISPSEGYDAMAKGVVDGNILEWEGLHVWNYKELLKYSTEVGIHLSPFVHVMNKDAYDNLPADLQELFTGADYMATINDGFGHQFDEDDIAYRFEVQDAYLAGGYDEIYILPDDEKQNWVEACSGIWEEYITSANAAGADGQAILDDALMYSEQFRYDGFCTECEDWFDEWKAAGHVPRWPGYSTVYEGYTGGYEVGG
ncbi:TRAP transporter substrate-binding protein DctP [Chloroflexota bacterium]